MTRTRRAGIGWTGGGTVFGDARAQGWRTAVVGWYNPYCTIYGDSLDSCYFMDVDRIDGFMSQRLGFWKNVYSPLEQMVREVRAPAKADKHACDYDVRQRYRTHVDLEDHAFDAARGGPGGLCVSAHGHPAQPQHLEPDRRPLYGVPATARTWTTWRWWTGCSATTWRC